MKFSYNWIAGMVRGLETDGVELMRLITLKTAECEGVESVGAHFDAVCAARVLSVEPLGGSHNRKAVVDTNRYGRRTLVCGAPNCRPGLVSAYVPAGVSLGGRRIEKRVVEGVESDGMLASGQELGINRDHEGILELDARPGDPLPGIRPDSVIEVDNKSLTHRPDLWGHYGMAREVAAILGLKLEDPVDLSLLPQGAAPIQVAIADFTLGPRYSALVFDNVTVKESPLWLQYRLEAIGLNPINNIVDVTNFVMAEIAEPMHAFDADKLHGDTIYVRPAREGERCVALNGEEYALGPSNLVIADAAGPVAIAGVIGGLESAITASTRRLVLESANFQAASIRRTSAKLKLRTDASMRFEKAQDPLNTVRGLARAVALLREVSPGIRVAGGLADSYRPAPPRAPIELPMDWLIRKLGRGIEPERVRSILEALQFGVNETAPRVFAVTVPSWRATKDISIKDDLTEEIGRMIGYDSITPRPPLVPATVPPGNPTRRYHHQVRAMAAAQGYTEVYNYSFVNQEMAARFGFAPEDHVRVANPISAEQGLLRTSLLPGLYKNITENARHFARFRLFEIGYEIRPRPEAEGAPGSEERLPDEIPHFAAVHYGGDHKGEGLMELKRLAECLCPGAEVRPAAARPFEHPARAGEVLWQGGPVGRIFELHPSLAESRAAILDLDLAVTERLAAGRVVRYQSVRRYPSSAFDLSVIVPVRTLAGDLERSLKQLGGADLVSIDFLRQYEGAPLAGGTKSVSFRLVVGAADRTLSSEEAGAIRQRIIDGMRALGHDLRV